MHVSGFMIYKKDVATALPTESLKEAGTKILEKNIGCLVVVEEKGGNDMDQAAVGIVTKTDLVAAYVNGLPLETTQVSSIMKTNIITVRDNLPRDQASRVFMRNKNHHAIVVGELGSFLGVISALDIVRETVKDDQAFPWIRSEDGKFHHPTQSPRSTAAVPHEEHERRSSFLDMVDSIREFPFMDD